MDKTPAGGKDYSCEERQETGEEKQETGEMQQTGEMQPTGEMQETGEMQQTGEMQPTGGASAPGEAPARYEVSVKHYARYDDSLPSYPPEVADNIRYASRNAFARFFIDFASVLARPSSFWKGQAAHPASLFNVYFPHLALLVVLRMAAFFIGGMLRAGSAPAALWVQTAAQGFLIFLLVWIMALAVAATTAVSGAGFRFDRALRFVAYGITPMLFVGIVGVIPLPYLPQICDLLAMPWAFVTMGCALLPYLNVKPSHAPVLSSLYCGLLLCLWGALPMLIPILLGLQLFP